MNMTENIFRSKEKVKLDRSVSPCQGDGASEARARRVNNVKCYLHGIGVELKCHNVSGIPCLIPHAKDMITINEQKSLHQCSTVRQYNCMFERLRYCVKYADKNTMKQCSTSSVSVDYEEYNESAMVRCFLSWQ